MKANTIVTVHLLSTVLIAMGTTAGSGQEFSDGSDAAAAPQQTGAPAGTVGEVRFLVPHIRSAQFSTGVGGRVTTVITATNGGATACDVDIDFHIAFNSDSNPECSITLSLAPLLASGTDTQNACSRSISGDRWTLCTVSCSPSLTFIQGKAIIRVPETCADEVAFDARLYHGDTSDDIRAINSLRVFRLRD